MSFSRSLSIVAGAAGLLVASAASMASAQDPELGDTGQGGWQGGQQQQQGGWGQQQQQQQQQGWGQPAETERPPAFHNNDDDEDDNSIDHELVSGHLGIGFFGTLTVPMPSLGATGTTVGSLSTPTVGIRYWFNENLGLDVALGFGFDSVEFTKDSDRTMGAQLVGFALHAGIPISFYAGKHYNFILKPELQFGVGSGSVSNNIDVEFDDDILSSFMFGVGARIGAEIQFGFIDVPELALQGTVGLHLKYEGTSYDHCTNDDCDGDGSDLYETSGFSVHTDLQEEPWDIFTGAITAIYYLP